LTSHLPRRDGAQIDSFILIWTEANLTAIRFECQVEILATIAMLNSTAKVGFKRENLI
jgi:hypothetical protein